MAEPGGYQDDPAWIAAKVETMSKNREGESQVDGWLRRIGAVGTMLRIKREYGEDDD